MQKVNLSITWSHANVVGSDIFPPNIYSESKYR